MDIWTLKGVLCREVINLSVGGGLQQSVCVNLTKDDLTKVDLTKVDDDNAQSHVWIKVHNLTLYISDREAFTSGDWLNNNIISAAQIKVY